MLIRAKLLAQLQVTEAMLDSAYNTLHTEGTKRDGREFGGLYVGTHSGQYSLELTEMAMIDSDSFLDMINTILTERAVTPIEANELTEETINTILKKSCP